MISISFFLLVTFLISEISFKAKGRTRRPPIIKRILVKVSGPTYSIPVVCATKAVPQIRAAPIRHNVEINCLENIKKTGSAGRIRTYDLSVNSRMLYR